MSDNAYTPRRTAWDVKFNGYGLGTTYEVDPSNLKVTLEPIKRGTTGNITLGWWILGIEGTLKVQVADVTREAMEKLTPWFAGSTGDSIPLVPPANANLYDYAQLLTLHPHDLASTDHSQDLNFLKAAAVAPPIAIKRNGNTDDLWQAEFAVFPDLGQLIASGPAKVYGYVGPIPV